MAAKGSLAAIRAFANKAGEHALRLAAILTVYRDHEATEIDAETVANAITLVEHYLGEATRVAGMAVVAEGDRRAQETLEFLQGLDHDHRVPGRGLPVRACVGSYRRRGSGGHADVGRPRVRRTNSRRRRDRWAAQERGVAGSADRRGGRTMTFKYDAAGALARIKAGLSQRAENQLSGCTPAKAANPANVGSAASKTLAALASLAGGHPEKRIFGKAVASENDASSPAENQKPEGPPAKVANPAKVGAEAQERLAGLAGLAGVPSDFHAGDHATQAVSSPIEDQKSARTPAKLANPANPFPATPLAAGPEDDFLPEGSAPAPADAAALARRAEFKKRAAAVANGGPPAPGTRRTGWPSTARRQRSASTITGCRGSRPRRSPSSTASASGWTDTRCPRAEDGCVVCGDVDRPNDDLLPVGLGGGEGRSWVHRGCSAAWRASRLAEAARELAAMGIADPASNPS